MELELNVFPAVEALNRTNKSRQLAYANFIKSTVDKVNEAIKADSALGITFTAVQVECTLLRGANKSPIDVLYEIFLDADYEVDINVIERKGVPHWEIQLDWGYADSGSQEPYSR
jgi:molybdenum cofactor biosynthesis enzyme MoaA